jgi:NhaP-type Na+/H+ or K+/H+ antiporter
MWKILGGVLVGVFLGALVVEVLKRTRPELLAGVEESAKAAASAITGAFQRGYTGSSLGDV